LPTKLSAITVYTVILHRKSMPVKDCLSQKKKLLILV